MGHSTGSGRTAGISILQGRVHESTTPQLMGAYDQLRNKSIQNMSNEEKMVRAVVIDELLQRGSLIVDAKTDDYVKNTAGDRVVYDEEKGRSYRVGRPGSVQNVASGRETRSVDAEFYFGGKWVEVKNLQTKIRVARLYDARRR